MKTKTKKITETFYSQSFNDELWIDDIKGLILDSIEIFSIDSECNYKKCGFYIDFKTDGSKKIIPVSFANRYYMTAKILRKEIEIVIEPSEIISEIDTRDTDGSLCLTLNIEGK